MATVGEDGRVASKLERFKRTFPAGAVIFRQGDAGHDMFILQEGQVEISHEVGGERRRLALLEKGDFFGEMALLEDYPERSATATALTSVQVLQLRGSDFEELVQTKPRVALRMMSKLSERLRESNRRLAELLDKPVIKDTLPALPTSQGIEAWAVLFHEKTARTFPLRTVGDTTLGRYDPISGVTPDIDLSGLDPERTVSRRHAMVRFLEGAFTVTEVNSSTNGTFVNGIRLQPFSPHPLHDGDLLQLATVSLVLRTLTRVG